MTVEKPINPDVIIKITARKLYELESAIEFETAAYEGACNRAKTNRDRYISAEARVSELAAQLATAQAALEQVTKERDAAQHFLSRIIEHCDDDGILPDDTTINLVAARKAAGMAEP